MSNSSPIFYPNVNRVPGQIEKNQNAKSGEKAVPGEFIKVLDSELDLKSIERPLKFSAHASQRLIDRGIHLDENEMAKLKDAVNRADAKGVDNTLVLTDNAAMIVSVKNRTVVTAMDKESLTQNVFTNIDGAVIV